MHNGKCKECDFRDRELAKIQDENLELKKLNDSLMLTADYWKKECEKMLAKVGLCV